MLDLLLDLVSVESSGSLWAVLWESPMDLMWESPMDLMWESPLDLMWESPLDLMWESPMDLLWEHLSARKWGKQREMLSAIR